MPTLNSEQQYLLPYIEKYKNLLKELGDSITDYQNFCGVPRFVTPQEMEWMIFQFYPALGNNLDKFLPSDLAKDILQKITKDAGEVIRNLTADDGYTKYRSDPTVATSDIELLMLAFTATKKILAAEVRKTATIEPIKVEGLWNVKNGSIQKLREIDSNDARSGIKGSKKEMSRLKSYLKKHRKREDIANTLYWEDGRIKTTMEHNQMFSEK